MFVGRASGSSGPTDEAAGLDWRLIVNVVLFVFGAVLRHKRLAAACCLAGAALGVGALWVVPFKYRSETVLLVRPNPLTGALSTAVNRELDAPTRFARETLLRRDNLEALAKKIGLVDRYVAKRPFAVRAKHAVYRRLFGHEPTREQLLGGLVDTLESQLGVEVWSDTIRISFTWWDRDIAHEVVQGALESFLQLRHEAEIKTIGEAIAILETHRTPLEQEINDQLHKLETDFAEERRLRRPAQLGPTAPSNDRELSRLEGTLAARRQAARDLESARQQRVQQLEAELVQQESIYAPDHPTVAGTRRMLASLSTPSARGKEIDGEIEQLELAIRQKRGPLSGGGSSLAEQVDLARELYGGLDPRTDYEFRRLDQLLAQHANLTDRINSARLEMETAQKAFDQRYSVIAPPQYPRGPIKPYGLALTLGGILGGLAFALFASTFVDLRGGLVLERWQVEQQLALPVLGEIRRS